MCIGSSSPAPPAAPVAPPVAPEAPRMPETPASRSGAASTASADRRRRGVAAGRTGTILTGSRGVTESGATATKTLLGE